MIRRLSTIAAAGCVLVFWLGGHADAGGSLLVSERSNYYTGYGSPQWPEMTNALDLAFDSIDVVSDFTDLSLMLQYDAIWLDQRFGGSLTAAEESNIQAFAATGRRAVLIGENGNWAAWNAQLVGMFGGTVGLDTNGVTTPVLVHELTDGVVTVDVASGSLIASGGTGLFVANFAALFGPNENVLIVLESNMFGQNQSGGSWWTLEDNAVWGTNVADWLCGEDVSTGVCFGDGSGAACGCANESDPGSNSGCLNSVSVGGVGAILSASGSASISTPDLTLNCSGVLTQPGLMFHGNNTIAGGAGSTFGDGVRCCGGSVIRLATLNPPAGPEPVEVTFVQTTTSGITAGDKRCYQYWYRDPSGPCSSTFNLSSAVTVTWGP